jgi:hypothetical protein
MAAAIVAFAFDSAARADILISIDKSTHQMMVLQDNFLLYQWPVSTGALGYDTPSGDFKPFRMERDHFSREWDDAPIQGDRRAGLARLRAAATGKRDHPVRPGQAGGHEPHQGRARRGNAGAGRAGGARQSRQVRRHRRQRRR